MRTDLLLSNRPPPRMTSAETALPSAVLTGEAAVARNIDVLSRAEQDCLGAMRVLIAGCGSVGGAVVEPLVRLGLGALVLADPETYDLTNVNRQACLRSDVGRPKAEVLAERVRAINPDVDAVVLRDGITEGNLAAALENVSVAFDGVDASTSPWEKYLLHQKACALRIPVLAGMDFGGKAVLYVFDYRRAGARPFYGKSSAEAHRSGRLDECLKWIGYSHFPNDFLPIIADRMRTRQPWPQVAYCVQAMGALGTRAVLDLGMNRRLPKVVAFDTHMELRRPAQRLREYASLPATLLSTYRSVRDRSALPPVMESSAADDRLARFLEENPVVQRVVAAVQLAPSPHNVQPWRLVLKGHDRIEVCWERGRAVPAVDPEGHAAAMGLGCAIQAAATVADISVEPGGDDIFAPDYRAGTLSIRGLKANGYAREMALLGKRTTNRYPFLDCSISEHTLERCARAAESFGMIATFGRPDPRHIARLAFEGAHALFRRGDYLDEFLAHLRLTDAEQRSAPLGFSRGSLAVGPASVAGMALLREFPRVRAFAGQAGLARLMATVGTNTVEHAAGYVLLAAPRWDTADRVAAGRAMLAVWLELTRADLACQPVDFPISNDEGRRAVSSLFGLASALRPFVFLRVGRATRQPEARAPRLSAQAICTLG